MRISWFPGHMVTARKDSALAMRSADVVIEVLDARAPLASCNPVIEALRRVNQRPALKLPQEECDPDAANADRSYEVEPMNREARLVKHGLDQPEEINQMDDQDKDGDGWWGLHRRLKDSLRASLAQLANLRNTCNNSSVSASSRRAEGLLPPTTPANRPRQARWSRSDGESRDDGGGSVPPSI